MSNTQIIISILIATIIGFVLGYIIIKLIKDKENATVKERLEQERNKLIDYKDLADKQLDDYKNIHIEEKLNLQKQVDSIEIDRNQLRLDKEKLNIQLAQKNSQLIHLEEKLVANKVEIEHIQEKFTKEFENLANKILEEKSSKFTEQNKENLKQILDPLQEKIQIFEQKVENSTKENTERHIKLGEQLKFLNEQNLKISAEANNLTKALKGDSKTQGNWGELILERVLEKSGLEKGREYELEKSFNVENGEKKRLRPDVIIHLPDNKKMIVDSKVSLTAYEKFVNTEDEKEQETYLKEHITSLNRHVTQLSAKKYEDLYEIESPDFVLLFVPIEPAFAVAVNHDNELYNKAFDKNIVIVTPSTLLATLRTIDSMWNNEKQQRNAMEIARQAGALYDKFNGLMVDLVKVGKKMDEAKSEYNGSMNKLFEGKGNLINSVEKIKKLGAKAKKQLPENLLNRAIEN